MPRILAKLAEALRIRNEVIHHDAVRKENTFLQFKLRKNKYDAMSDLTLGHTGRLRLWKL
jgi:hypothetical protein